MPRPHHAAFPPFFAVPKAKDPHISFLSLKLDDIARSKSLPISQGPRFVPRTVNGNLAPILIPSGRPDDAASGGKVSSLTFNLVDTNTRTVWRDAFYAMDKSTIQEFIESPESKSRNSVMTRRTGHVAMDLCSPTDPRVRRRACSPDLGPGTFNDDMMRMHTTGMLPLPEGQSHAMVAYAKDPTRPSPEFKALPRDSPDPSRTACATPSLPPDYDSWTSKGCYSPQGRRGTWATPSVAVDVVYEPHMTQSGSPSTCAGYASAPSSPSYRVAFGSAIPRLVALQDRADRSDTRLINTKSYESASATPASAGPGAYSLEPPRYKSFHNAYTQAKNYDSLASASASSAPLPPSRGGGARRGGGGVAMGDGWPLELPTQSLNRVDSPTTGSSYSTLPFHSLPYGLAGLGGSSAPSSPPIVGTSHGSRSGRRDHTVIISSWNLPLEEIPLPSTSQEDTTVAAAADWAMHTNLTKSHFSTGGEGARGAGVEAGLDDSEVAAAASSTEAGAGGSRVRECQAQIQAQLAFTASYSQASQARRAERFGSLVFNQRETPHQLLIRTKLAAKEDVHKAREEAGAKTKA